jgi:hypothetical protein
MPRPNRLPAPELIRLSLRKTARLGNRNHGLIATEAGTALWIKKI